MTRHFSHIFFAEAETFIFGDPASVPIGTSPSSTGDPNRIPVVFDVYILGGRAARHGSPVDINDVGLSQESTALRGLLPGV